MSAWEKIKEKNGSEYKLITNENNSAWERIKAKTTYNTKIEINPYARQASNLPNYKKNLEQANPYEFYSSIDIENLKTGKQRPALCIAASIAKSQGKLDKSYSTPSTVPVFQNAAPVTTKEELATYRTLKDAGYEIEAQKYIDSILPEVYKRETDNLIKNIEDAGTLENIFNYALFGKMGGFTYLNTMFTPEGEIDTNSRGYQLTAMRQAAMNKLVSNSKHPELASIGLSAVDLLSSLGFGVAGALTQMGTMVAGDTVYDVLERGGTKKQAITQGTAAAAIEVATELIPVKHLFKLAKPISALVKKQGTSVLKKAEKDIIFSAVKGILKQAGLNASQEIVAEYAQTILDNAVMGEKSNYNLYKKHLISNGMNEDEAGKAANTMFYVTQPLIVGAGGALLGVGFGAPAVGLGAVRQAKIEKDAKLTLEKSGITDKKEQDEIISRIKNGNLNAVQEAVLDKIAPTKASIEQKQPLANNINLLSQKEKSKAYEGMARDVISKPLETQKQDVSFGKDSGIVKNGLEEYLDRNDKSTLDLLGKKLGARVELVAPNSLKVDKNAIDENGRYIGEYADSSYMNGTIYIDMSKIEDSVAITLAKHEITHRVQNLAPKEYQEYRNYVVNNILEKGDVSLFTERMKQLANSYSKAKKQGDAAVLIDEFVADYTANLLTNEKAIQNLCKENMSLGQKILQWVRDLLKKLKKNIEEPVEEAAENYGLDISEIERAEQLFVNALEKTSIEAKKENTSGSNNEVEYSLRSANESQKELSALKRERDRLKEQLVRAKEEVKLTKGAKTDAREVHKQAKSILKEYNSNYSINELTKELQAFYDSINNATSEELDFNDIMNDSFDIAFKVVDNAQILDNELSKEYADLKYYLRTTPIRISSDAKKEMADLYSTFVKENRSRIKIRQNGIDSAKAYRELGEKYPEFFPEDITSLSEQLYQIEKVLDDVAPVWINPFSTQLDQAAQWLALDIYERYFDTRQRHTFADKQNLKLQKEKGQEKVQQQKDQIVAERVNHSLHIKKLLLSEAERRHNAVARITEKYKAKTDKAKEKQKQQVLRKKIMAIAKPLGNKLKDNNKNSHVPAELRQPIAALFSNIDFTSSRQKEETKQKLNDVREMYREISKKEESNILINAELEAEIKLLENFVSTKPISEMDSNELNSLYNVMLQLKHIVSSVNKTFNEKIKTQIDEDLKNAVKEMNYGKDYPRGSKEDSNFPRRLQSFMRIDMLRPEVFFGELGETSLKYYYALREGYDQYIRYINEARTFSSKLVEGHDLDKMGYYQGAFDNIKNKATAKRVKLEKGTFYLTPAELMEIYLLARRPQGLKHLIGDGVKISRINKSFTLTEKDVDKISNPEQGYLTASQIKIANGMADFLAKTAEWGNAASLKLYGVEIFNDKNYWTIMINKNIRDYNLGDKDKPLSLLEYGSTKPLDPNANNQVIIGNVFDTYLKQVDFMANYGALAVPLTDLQRLFNSKTKIKEKNGEEKTVRFKESVERLLGKNGNNYIENFLEDVNGGGRTEIGTQNYTKLLSWSKRGLILFNTPVTLQQFSSLPNAIASKE